MTTTAIEEAAKWLSLQHQPPQPIMKYLRDNFSLTTAEAAQACTLANTFRSERRQRD